ncbi:putative capsular polysaccharide synthesis family protein [Cognatilysobacter terrigena]|uniref:putative capsular polysaccharide synthesis family protein n=1 Tax=Cognatilysobacter terrigena TaxID=2488749 RepID=UPI001414F694|nr:putative capsular polysaccharide synthesis family protein [Lysobacter terrigena]
MDDMQAKATPDVWWLGSLSHDGYRAWRTAGRAVRAAPAMSSDDPVALSPWDWLAACREQADGASPHAWTRAILRFVHHIEAGSIVVAGSGDTYAVGKVLDSDARFDGDTLVRDVDWQHEIPAFRLAAARPERWRDYVAPERLHASHARVVLGWAPVLPDRVDLSVNRRELRLVKPAEPTIPILFQSPYAERILREFRWREYLHANPDVAATEYSEAFARNHFINQGYCERRIFDPQRMHGFDAPFYRQRYPELQLNTDADAWVHYCYVGYYEDRIANRDTAWFYDARLHIFQMGKVASHTIAHAIEGRYNGGVVHAHWVTDIPVAYPSTRLPYSRLLVHPREQPVQVISAARELVSWALSAIAHSHAAACTSFDELMSTVENEFWTRCGHGARWFDHRYFCDLDVTRHAFNHVAGCSRIAHPGMDLLIYRQENLDQLARPLSEFLGITIDRLDARNTAESKRHGVLYRKVVEEFSVPTNDLVRLYETPFMRTFYSDDERGDFVRFWRSGTVRRSNRSWPVGGRRSRSAAPSDSGVYRSSDQAGIERPHAFN